jgi:hypothetical protein
MLKNLEWTGGNKIFGNNVFIISYLYPSVLVNQVSPSCYIEELGFANHTEEPLIVIARFNLLYFIENIGKFEGGNIVTGGNNIINSSRGVGYLELERKIQKEIIKTFKLTDRIQIFEVNGIKTSQIPANAPNVYRINTFDAFLYLGD